MQTKHSITWLRNIALSTILAAGVASPTYIAYADTADSNADTTKESSEEREQSFTSELFGKINMAAVPQDSKPVKEETVYVFADATGKAYDTLVKDQITNTSSTNELFDKSYLNDIEIDSDDVESNANGEAITWSTNGEGVSYQGKTDKECPVQMQVSYMLDGKKVSPEDIAGKSGHVVIRFDFKNNATTTATIEGESKTMYTPFVAISGFSLDNSRFTNIEVTNAKATAGSDETTIAGYVMPGMQENLGMDEEDFDFPSYFEVSADVQDFKLGTTTTIVTNSLFGELDVDGMDTSEMRDGLTKMSDAMNELVSGTSSLYDGLSQLASGSDSLTSGINKLADGTAELPDGTAALAEGTDGLATGLDELASGAENAASGSENLAAGASNLQSVAQELVSGIQLAVTGTQTLSDALASVDTSSMYASSTALSSDSQALGAASSDLQGASVNIDSAIAEINANANLTDEEKVALTSYLNNAKSSVDGASATVGTAAGNSGAASSQLATAAGTLDAANSGVTNLSSSLAQIQIGAEALAEGTSNLSSGASELSSGIDGLAAGNAEAASGAKQLSESMHTLADATPALVEGIDALKSGSSQLSEGMHSAADGSLQLADGLQQFNDEGVQAMLDAYDDNLGGLSDRLKATADADKGYTNFSGIDPSMTGSVKFIYETDEITAGN